jgi:hypothetical protein
MTNRKHVEHEIAKQARELTSDELEEVSGGSSQAQWTYTKQKADGTARGNVAAQWSVAQGAAA